MHQGIEDRCFSIQMEYVIEDTKTVSGTRMAPMTPEVEACFRKILEDKEGGIMTKPTVFGMNGSALMAGGEAGSEAILPLSGFYKQLEAMLDDKLNMHNVEKYLAVIAANSGKGIYLDDGTLVGRLLPAIDSGLGQTQKLNARLSL